tara:strand:- start:501 stop:2831 length:2331 start_codon:yes stop_codon:yes gene_type:complete
MTIIRKDTNEAQEEIRRIIKAALVGTLIDERINSDAPELYDNSKVVLERRYLGKDREGNVLEDFEDMFTRVAENLAEAEGKYDDSAEAKEEAVAKFRAVMRKLDFLPNSPTLMNAGRDLQQLSACFVLPVEDSLDAIFDRVRHTAIIHKSGGGTGFSFSRLRPEGDTVGSTGGVASGPVSFINAFDAATDVVKQGGTRRGANMGILEVTHPDVMKFITSKEDGTHLNNFNISVAITEEFMEKVSANADYDLINPHDGSFAGTLNAKEVFDTMTELAWKTGDPGIVFLDRINRDNPNPQLGKIESTNPCGEQPLLPYESCNLGSINLAHMVHFNGDVVEIDWERLSETVKSSVHLLDNVIDMNNYPIEAIAEMSRTTRRIGVGIMGFADLLVQLGIKYDSYEAVDLAETIMERIQEETYTASGELAEIRGTFPAWDESIYNQEGNQRKMRNSAPVTIAPTGTISIIAGTSSGIEPLFALSYVRNIMDNTKLVEANPYFEAVAKSEGFYSQELMEELAEKGTLHDMDVPEWVKEVFRTAHDISPEWHVRMQAAFQRFTDNSVSKTINFPSDATVADVKEAYTLAYETGCKGITVYRDGSKSGQTLNTGGSLAETNVASSERTAAERPRVLNGTTHLVRTGHGNMYVTINCDQDGNPFEVFGALGKAGGSDSAQLEAISRLVSLALRSGIGADEIVEQLKGISDDSPAWDEGELVKSTPDAVAIALRNYVDGAREEENESWSLANIIGLGGKPCPECDDRLIMEEGCDKCMSCGYSKCD